MMKTLSQIVSEVRAIETEHAMVAEMDAGFDGGEFSAPAHERAVLRETAEALEAAGWTAHDVIQATVDRTSAKWSREQLPWALDVLDASWRYDGPDRQWEAEYRAHSSSITGIFEGA